MNNLEILHAIYNDKEILSELHKSIQEYAINLKSMDQLKLDSKDIEKFVKDNYRISPTLFKKIVKLSCEEDSNLEEVIDELQIIHEIAKAQ